jgi:hypothetical protein
VSQFAAGCAICGENLVAARRRLEERRAASPVARLRRPSWLPQMTGGEMTLGALLFIAAFFLPVVGIFIAGFVAFFAHRNHEVVQRNLALIAVGIALVVLLLISFVPETLDELLPWVDLSGPVPS